VEWRRTRKGGVELFREGLKSGDGSGQIVSVFYFLLDEFSPWIGPPNAQLLVEDGLVSLDDRVERAEANRGLYHQYLSWGAIKDNLVANSLATERQIQRHDVHYRFLSAFVHPIANLNRSLYGRNRPWPSYDHYSSELGLLYANVLSAHELENFAVMARRPPSVVLDDWTRTAAEVREAKAMTNHLWLFEDSPHAYDRFSVPNERAFALSGSDAIAVRPEDLPSEEITYYNNPLTRLIGQHRSSVE
jgi:hypothetical protein